MIIEENSYAIQTASVRRALGSASKIYQRTVTIAVEQVEQVQHRRPIVGGDYWRGAGARVTVHQYHGSEVGEQRTKIIFGHPRCAQHNPVAAPSSLDGKDPLLGRRLG